MKTILGFIVVGLLAGLVPFGLIALARSQPSTQPPVHPIQDMFKQEKFLPQGGNRMFADGRAMRPRLPGVTASTDLQVNDEMVNNTDDPHMIDLRNAPLELNDESTYQRVVEGIEPQADGKPGYVKQIPIKVSRDGAMDLLRRGRERYTIYCAVCHGQGGYGDGAVALRAAEIQAANGDAAGWVAPKNYHTDDMRQQPVGKLYNTIANGVRSMPAYAKQISVLDRWAIVAYVKALQRSQDAKPEDIPESEKDKYQ
ncbi:MAG: c-type cytochrome [Thermoguttaceae bacterium]